MVLRAIIQAARIIVSRPGVPVSTSMADSDKIFDSDWNWSGVLLEAGSASDPGGGDWSLLFKRDYGYAPAVVARSFAASGPPFQQPWSGPMVVSPMQQTGNGANHPYIFSNRIVFPRAGANGTTANYGYVEYEVYGVD